AGGERRTVSASPPRAAHPRIPATLPRPTRQQDADLQRRLWAFRRERRRERHREPYQQAPQEAEAPSRIRSDRFEAISRLLHREIRRLAIEPHPARVREGAFVARSGFPARLGGVLTRGQGKAARGEAL